MTAKKEPKLKEVTITASVGGKIQVVKFEYDSNFHYSNGATYNVEGMTEEQVEKFRLEKTKEFRKQLEPIQQDEIDKLQALRDEIRDGGEGSTEEDA